MEEGNNDTDEPDIKRLISQRRKRPAFARMISWEFSSAAEKLETGKKQTTKRKQKSGSDADKADLARGEVKGRHDRLSTIGSVESSSSDDSEYYSAAEDEDDLEVICNMLDNSDYTDTAVDGVFSAEGPGVEERLAKDDSLSACLHPGRRRRLSKKQKRKRTKDYRIMFADNYLVLGNLLDFSGDIDEACEQGEEHWELLSVQKSVPTLVELCMSATGRVGKRDYNQLPLAMKRSVTSWRSGQHNVRRQLTWLQNHILPFADNARNFSNLLIWRDGEKSDYDLKIYHDVFVFPTRSVWDSLPRPYKPQWNPTRSIYSSGKTASFLLCVDLRYRDLSNVDIDDSYVDIITGHALTSITNFSALASCIDMMLPAAVTDRSLGPRTVSDDKLLSQGMQTILARLKHALKSRFPRLMEELYDRALPYVMWARGNAPLATEMFRTLVQEEKRSRHKAMYLSEIGRMYAMFGDSEMASTFYKLATETALEKGKQQASDIDEATEQLQVLRAQAHDTGVMSTEKAYKASQYWTGALNLPQQRLLTTLAAIDSFLCYHAYHWKGKRWTEEALARIALCGKDHPYLNYYASMLLAMDGKSLESKRMYGDVRARMMDNFPGQAILSCSCARKEKMRNPWQPLVTIATSQKSPIMPLHVVWRTQLTAPDIGDSGPFEADYTAERLNLRLNVDGNLTGDMQMVLPPIRDVSLDPYDGSYVVNHVPSFTGTWKSSYFSDKRFKFGDMFIPTHHLLYSDKDGTTLHLEKASVHVCAGSMLSREDTPLLILHWQSGGQRAKLNLNHIYRSEMTKITENHIRKRKNISAEVKQELMDMIPICVRTNRSLLMRTLMDSYIIKLKHADDAKAEYADDATAEKKGQKGSKKPAKRGKFSYLHNNKSWLTQTDEAIVYGKTVWIPFKCQIPKYWALFINTRSRQEFLKYKFVEDRRIQRKLPPFQQDSTDSEFLLLQNSTVTDNLEIYGEGGEPIQVLERMSLDCASELFCIDCCPCIIGSHLFSIAKGKISIWKHLIGLEDDKDNDRGDHSSCAFTPYWSPLDGSDVDEIQDMKVVGKDFQGIGKLLVLHSTLGLSFMDPESTNLVNIIVSTEDSKCDLPLNDDGNIVLGIFATIAVLAEKHYCEDGRQISLVAVAVDYHVLVFQIQTMGRRCPFMELVTSLTLPGFAKEACFIGRVGILVSVSQQTDKDQHYREHLFHFKLDGHLYGMLPCLGMGPRSFLPIYLRGNSDTEDEGRVGWYVYMRDGHGGIIGVKLHGKDL